MQVNVEFYAIAREVARVPACQFDLPDGSTVGDVRRVLHRMWDSPIFTRCALALDELTVEDSRALHEGARVAVLPPVGGG